MSVRTRVGSQKLAEAGAAQDVPQMQERQLGPALQIQAEGKGLVFDKQRPSRNLILLGRCT